MSKKRSRCSDPPPEVVSATLAKANAVANGLKDYDVDSMEEHMLWDTKLIQINVQPTLYHSKDTSHVGRAKAKDLLQVLLGLKGGDRLQIHGANGSGKSTVISALVGYMLRVLKKEVVYICASCFIDANLEVLQHALLVSSGDEGLASLTEMEELYSWCEGRLNPLLFVVDEWDEFEKCPEDERALMLAVLSHHILVKVSTTGSREERVFDFNGPYTQDELQTWIAISSLPEAKLPRLEALTSGMPRLLRYYEESEGDERLFKHKIRKSYTVKLFDGLVGLQKTKAQLASAVKMVTTGVPGDCLVKPVDLTCFYKVGNRFRIMSPYLRSKAWNYITLQKKIIDVAEKDLGNMVREPDDGKPSCPIPKQRRSIKSSTMTRKEPRFG